MEEHTKTHKINSDQHYCLHPKCTLSTETFYALGLEQHTRDVHGCGIISVTTDASVSALHTCSNYFEWEGMPEITNKGPEWEGTPSCHPLCIVNLISASSSYKGAEDCLTNAGGPNLKIASWGCKGQNLAADCPHSTTRIESCSNDSYETLFFVYRATDPEAYYYYQVPSGSGGGVSIEWTGLIMKISEDEFDPSVHIIITE